MIRLSSPAQPSAATSPLFRAGLALGGLAGALGVALSALAAHLDGTGLLSTAAEMLLFHAPAFLALAALAQVRRVPLLPLTLGLLALGLLLFAGDLVSRAFRDARLFPMAAPTGGMLLIVGWASAALSTLVVRPRADP
ncbi:DUF423 domain-containing protein [Pannonibacter tanglangensis]|uniref:DUF423 domain-containing protein n=1 Tax=Pannonibacter tanglangensis TaxID=2750084 RepID=A0ABW9ZCS3_9HYPH|nr:DUF423 domain-containing protein [Pannonibacter sp. XCT-34]NBN62463.1 DUF423 domain-containing protein [Pannonibacter sp. XCT-34]